RGPRGAALQARAALGTARRADGAARGGRPGRDRRDRRRVRGRRRARRGGARGDAPAAHRPRVRGDPARVAARARAVRRGERRAARLFKLELPWALPDVLTGLRVAGGLAVIGAIVGEFVGGGGLGVVVLEAMRQQRTDLVFAAILHASLLGLALFAAVSAASRLLLRRWHVSEGES